jgi:hypothetical protein
LANVVNSPANGSLSLLQHAHILDHALAPLARRYAERRALRLPQRARAAAGAGHQAGAAVGQDIERGPFVGEDERIAQRERAHAGRPDEHALGAPRHRRQQGERIEAAIDEQRVAAPDRIERRARLDRVGEREQVARAAQPDQHAAVRQRDAEVHVRSRPRP